MRVGCTDSISLDLGLAIGVASVVVSILAAVLSAFVLAGVPGGCETGLPLCRYSRMSGRSVAGTLGLLNGLGVFRHGLFFGAGGPGDGGVAVNAGILGFCGLLQHGGRCLVDGGLGVYNKCSTRIHHICRTTIDGGRQTAIDVLGRGWGY
jgi:hypothetical protein